MTGTEGEEELARLVGGKSQQYRKTSQPLLDFLTENGISYTIH